MVFVHSSLVGAVFLAILAMFRLWIWFAFLAAVTMLAFALARRSS